MPPKPSPPTHFVCLPLGGAQLARSLASFKADVTSPMSFAIPQDAVRPFGTLHLTLGVMSLKDDGIQRATELLQGLRLREMLASAEAVAAAATAKQPPASEDGPLSITLQGLHAMQSPAKTTVLYAPPVDEAGILYRFCEQIKRAFQEAGLMAEENRPLLLHATVINTIYVKGRRRERLTLDARDMINRYDGFVWAGNLPIERVTLCRMGAKKIEGTDDEAYEVEAAVEL